MVVEKVLGILIVKIGGKHSPQLLTMGKVELKVAKVPTPLPSVQCKQ